MSIGAQMCRSYLVVSLLTSFDSFLPWTSSLLSSSSIRSTIRRPNYYSVTALSTNNPAGIEGPMLSESKGLEARSGRNQSPRAGGKMNNNNKKMGSSNGLGRGNADRNIYRADGVRITHDPYAPGVAERYGLPGKTDSEGFDPYADTVGPGIYGGSVKRDENGDVIIGKQYQNHNRAPGPVYDDKGYSLMSRAIHAGPSKVSQLLSTYPQLAHEISTGGATPLHVCGMSQSGQKSTQTLINKGADINAVDTYGYTALHRMCSNNLPEGAEILLKAGADPNGRLKGGESPVDVARSSRASKVLALLQRLGY